VKIDHGDRAGFIEKVDRDVVGRLITREHTNRTTVELMVPMNFFRESNRKESGGAVGRVNPIRWEATFSPKSTAATSS
jgi:hypothetical protein